MKKLLLALVLFASSAQAATHTFTGTIDTPPVMVWVDEGGSTVAPFVSLSATSPLFVDSITGYVWAIQGTRSATPTLTALAVANLGLLYTSTNCTGTAYLPASPVDMTGAVLFWDTTGGFYANGALASVTIHSRNVGGNCYVDTVAAPIYEAVGPLTPPTLSAGPWHLEVR